LSDEHNIDYSYYLSLAMEIRYLHFSAGDLSQHIDNDHAHQFRYKAVSVPKHQCPFLTGQQAVAFAEALEQTKAAGLIPPGLALEDQDWENGEYPTVETIKSGRHATCTLTINLLHNPWRIGALHWGRALNIMNQLTLTAETFHHSDNSSDDGSGSSGTEGDSEDS
jgi:hypothetical protein